MIAKPRFGRFLKAVRDNDRESLRRDYGSDYVQETTAYVRKSPLGEESGSLGGYTVGPDFTTQFLRTIAERSFIWPRASVVTMTGAEAFAPKIDVESSQTAAASGVAVASPLFGGLKFQFGSGPQQQSPSPSAAPPQATTAAFRQLSLKAWDLLGYVTCTNQLIEDLTPEGEQQLLTLFADAAVWATEFAFLQGSGTSGQMPLGILNSPATILQSRTTGSQIKTADVANMAGSLLPFAWEDAIWACSPSAIPQIAALSTFYVNAAADGMPGPLIGYLLTRPCFVTDKLPTLGTTGDLILFSPRMYAIGARQDVLIDRSRENPGVFLSNEVDFRIWLRCDGKPVQSNTTKTVGGDVVSAFVALHS